MKTKHAILSLIFALLLLFGCKTTNDIQYVDREVIRYVDKLIKDSVYINNTDTIKIEQKGDTVFLTNIKWRIQYRDKLQRDTFLLTDSIKVYVDKKEIVEKNKRGILDWIGLTSLIALLIFILYKLRRFFI